MLRISRIVGGRKGRLRVLKMLSQQCGGGTVGKQIWTWDWKRGAGLNTVYRMSS